MNKTVLRFLSKLTVLMNELFYQICWVLPVNNHRILMESEGDFTDNIRVFYDWLIRNKYNEKYEIIWIVHDPKKYKREKNVKFISRFHRGLKLSAYYYAATSRFLLFSHPYWIRRWRKEQYNINTTHSVAQLKAGTFKRKLSDYVLCCSEYCKSIKSQVFTVEDENILILGMPRIDLMFEHTNCLPVLFTGHELEWSNKKLILSMETFKQNVNMMDSDQAAGYVINVIHSESDIRELDSILGELDCIMVVKIHHLQDMNFLKEIHLKNICYLTDEKLQQADIQVNQLLENADVLLTDYSSVFYDYLLMDRPIGFTIGDIRQYKRGFIMGNPLEEMPGKKLRNLNELVIFLRESLKGEDRYQDERRKIREKVFCYQDGHNCERLYEWMMNR